MSEAETAEGLRSRWREPIRPPAWREAPPELLREARKLGEAVLDPAANLGTLNRRSLTLPGKLP